tara:strand:- start:252 stop:506 length:255 start_codon:yes stop_codon:yes gene_type:complete
MKNLIKYILLFLALKPIITAFGYPKNIIRFGDIGTGGVVDTGRVKDFGYHMTNYFEYHNEAFAYSFILTLLTFLFFDKRSKKTS